MRGYGVDGVDKVGDRTYSARTVAGAVASPPYGDQQVTGQGNFFSAKCPEATPAREHNLDGYEDSAAGVITSPPYSDAGLPPGVSHAVRKLALAGQWDEAIALVEKHEADQVKRGTRMALKLRETIRAHIEAALESEFGYSGAVSSPPYLDSDPRANPNFELLPGMKAGPNSVLRTPTSTSKHAQIGNLRDPRGDIDAVLSSPPYSDVVSLARAASRKRENHRLTEKGLTGRNYGQNADGEIPHFTYGREPGQIGNLPDEVPGSNGSAKKETYLGAMLRVYHQLYRVLRPGGVVCLVTKNPVKDKQIRRLDSDTIRLMEACGFRLIERHAAMLAEETEVPQLFDAAPRIQRKERKSFFKRLFESKPENAHLRVDHEDVLWFQKD